MVVPQPISVHQSLGLFFFGHGNLYHEFGFIQVYRKPVLEALVDIRSLDAGLFATRV